jgi:hypothetical protein
MPQLHNPPKLSYIRSLVKLGDSLKEATDYAQIRGVMDDHRSLLDATDQNYIFSKSEIRSG